MIAHDLAVRGRLSGVSLELRPGEVLGVVGPNGAGKSTLLRSFSGEIRPDGGGVSLDGAPVHRWDPLALARRRAVVPQAQVPALPFAVRELVALGRLPHGDADPRGSIEASIAQLGLAGLADRPCTQLSGGELARAHLARALAQVEGAAPPAFLLLDEPTAALDLAWQERALDAVIALTRRGVGALVIVHDLDLAARACDRVAVLDRGGLRALGPPAEALAPALLREIWGVPFAALRRGGRLRLLCDTLSEEEPNESA